MKISSSIHDDISTIMKEIEDSEIHELLSGKSQSRIGYNGEAIVVEFIDGEIATDIRYTDVRYTFSISPLEINWDYKYDCQDQYSVMNFGIVQFEQWEESEQFEVRDFESMIKWMYDKIVEYKEG